MRHWGRVAGRCERSAATLLKVDSMATRFGVAGESLAKHIGNGRQAITCLVGGHVVNVRGVGQLGRLVCDVASEGVGVVHASERLAKRCRLNNTLVRKGLVRGSNDGKARGSLVPARHAGGLRGEGVGAVLVGRIHRAVALGGLLL